MPIVVFITIILINDPSYLQ